MNLKMLVDVTFFCYVTTAIEFLYYEFVLIFANGDHMQFQIDDGLCQEIFLYVSFRTKC